jgi:hypothetical protein
MLVMLDLFEATCPNRSLERIVKCSEIMDALLGNLKKRRSLHLLQQQTVEEIRRIAEGKFDSICSHSHLSSKTVQ